MPEQVPGGINQSAREKLTAQIEHIKATMEMKRRAQDSLTPGGGESDELHQLATERDRLIAERDRLTGSGE